MGMIIRNIRLIFRLCSYFYMSCLIHH